MSQTIPTFSEIFIDTFNISGGATITSLNNDIYFTTYNQNSTQGVIFIKVDSQGNKLNQDEFYNPDVYYFGGEHKSLKSTSDNQIIWATQGGSDSPYATWAYLIKFNATNLDTQYVKKYNRRNFSSFSSVAELSDKRYLVAGSDWDSAHPGQSVAWLVKTDTSGNILWQKTMSSDLISVAAFTSPFLGGFYQFWDTYHNGMINAGTNSAMFVDRYDNAGNLYWRDTFGIAGHENVPGPFTATKDGGGLIFVNVLDTINPSNGLSGLPSIIYKFDSTGRILWSHFMPQLPRYLYMNSMIESKSGNIVLCGDGVSDASSGSHGGGALLKLDKAGNQVFYQVYRNDSSIYDVFNDIVETSDGGYAAVGNAFQPLSQGGHQRAWLLKVDSNGCLNGNCPTIIHTGIEDVPAAFSFFVFPNPATSVFTVALAGSHDIDRYHDLHFMLYDLTGRIVMNEAIKEQTTTLHKDDIPDGLYLWQIADGEQTLINGKLALR